ncbi:hypothetical protein VPH35_009241 [Triticum aestivum]
MTSLYRCDSPTGTPPQSRPPWPSTRCRLAGLLRQISRKSPPWLRRLSTRARTRLSVRLRPLRLRLPVRPCWPPEPLSGRHAQAPPPLRRCASASPLPCPHGLGLCRLRLSRAPPAPSGLAGPRLPAAHGLAPPPGSRPHSSPPSAPIRAPPRLCEALPAPPILFRCRSALRGTPLLNLPGGSASASPDCIL